MLRKFVRFPEIETELQKKAPSIVYKYRSWGSEKHRRVLTNRELWFAHPFTLEDPLDVRPEACFDISELQEPRMLEKLLDSVGIQKPELIDDRARRIYAENRWDYLKENPGEVLKNREEYMATEENFDPFGVFSVCINPLSEKMWEEYGDLHSGYCIGFKTVELCRQAKSGFGFVEYCDSPLPFSFFDETKENDLRALYYKKRKWQYEEEFRLITVGVGVHSQRLQTVSIETVAKVILGYEISPEHEQEILNVIKNQYNHAIPVYKTFVDDSNILMKSRIS